MKKSEYRFLKAKNAFLSNGYTVVAVAMIIFMAFTDFTNLVNLFQQMGLSDFNVVLDMMGAPPSWSEGLSDSVVFSLISVLFLEFLPVSLGSMLAKMIDRTQHMNTEKRKNNIGLWVGLICFIAVSAVVVYMRCMMFVASGAFADWWTIVTGRGSIADSVNKYNFIAQLFLIPLPVLTSLWAFVVSWDITTARNLDNLKLEVEKLRRNMVAADKAYMKADSKKKDVKWALWCDLALTEEVMPNNYDVFRYECTKRIRSRHISECILQYRNESKRYDSNAMKLLTDLQQELAKRSTVPEKIMAISIDDLIQNHDRDLPDADCWDYEKSYADQERLLKKLLMNATVIAQYKTADTPIFTEARSNTDL